MARILIGNIKGPQGDTGQQGPQGEIGPVGPQGPLPPLINNALATEAGVAALDAVMGKTLQDQITQTNSNLTYKNYSRNFERNSNSSDVVFFTRYGNIKRFSMYGINEWDSPVDVEIKLCDIPTECSPDGNFYKYVEFAKNRHGYVSTHGGSLWLIPSDALPSGSLITMQDVYF